MNPQSGNEKGRSPQPAKNTDDTATIADRQDLRKPLSVEQVFSELAATIGWEPTFTAGFYQEIIKAGFNRATVKQAFVLAQIVEELGPITVRGAMYRGQAAGIFPDTSDSYYNTTAYLILNLRRKSILDYEKIVDSVRRRLKPSSWANVGDFMETVREAYRKNLWSGQREYVEVFCEKDAMAGIIEPVTAEYDVTLNIIRGQVSETFAWNVAEVWNQISKPIVAYYLGDHDPAGLAIESALMSKLYRFGARKFEWHRLAVSLEDFADQTIRGFSVKGDRSKKAWQTRHADYLARYGDRCVEVDAISPDVVRARIRESIESHIDRGAWESLKAVESLERDSVQQFMLGQKA
jgi:hypothetical protein